MLTVKCMRHNVAGASSRAMSASANAAAVYASSKARGQALASHEASASELGALPWTAAFDQQRIVQLQPDAGQSTSSSGSFCVYTAGPKASQDGTPNSVDGTPPFVVLLLHG
jgi:hypothetical protein